MTSKTDDQLVADILRSLAETGRTFAQAKSRRSVKLRNAKKAIIKRRVKRAKAA